MYSHTGVVVWFDASSGEGMVQDSATGELYYVHYTCIDGVARNGYAYPHESDRPRLEGLRNAPCTFSLYVNLYSARVERLSLGA